MSFHSNILSLIVKQTKNGFRNLLNLFFRKDLAGESSLDMTISDENGMFISQNDETFHNRKELVSIFNFTLKQGLKNNWMWCSNLFQLKDFLNVLY